MIDIRKCSLDLLFGVNLHEASCNNADKLENNTTPEYIKPITQMTNSLKSSIIQFMPLILFTLLKGFFFFNLPCLFYSFESKVRSQIVIAQNTTAAHCNKL